MKIGLLIISMLLAGCDSGYVYITSKGVEETQRLCAANGGLKNVAVYAIDGTYDYPIAYCNNGAIFHTEAVIR